MGLEAFDDPITPHLCSRFGMDIHDVLFFNENSGDVVYLTQDMGCCSQHDYKMFWTVVRSDMSELYVYCPDDQDAPTVRELLMKVAKVIAQEGTLLTRNLYSEAFGKQ